ncbi:hypothetical protein LKA79_004577, partial [Salmonella enterica]|nr:hypothetical protein [Salmonella enterica]
ETPDGNKEAWSGKDRRNNAKDGFEFLPEICSRKRSNSANRHGILLVTG